MSRLARKSIAIPSGVTVSEANGVLLVKGPKGDRQVRIPRNVTATTQDQGVMITGKDTESNNPHIGTTWSLVQNAIIGVTDGFSKVLEIEGVGYKAALEGKTLVLSLGFVHPVKIVPPEGVTVVVEKNNIIISGADKETVGQMAAQIRAEKKPEPYKGKGIHYRGEVIRRKVGKKAGATTT